MTTYHHTNVSGQKLVYRKAGSNDLPTIVLLHGFPEMTLVRRRMS